MKEKILELITKLKLSPHPEGGFYKETYRSEGEISEESLGEKYTGSRNHATSIYFLLTSDTFSAFHRIRQDEIWHFYVGSPLHLHVINPEGEYSQTIVGNDVLNNHTPQIVVTGGSWFAANVIDENSYSLVGCTVSPGFDFLDFDLAKRKELINTFPQHNKIITDLTRG
jgi:hypothetical protein